MENQLSTLKDNLYNVAIFLSELKQPKEFIEANRDELAQLYSATAIFGSIYKQKLLKANGKKEIEALDIDALYNSTFNLTQLLAPGDDGYIAANAAALDNLYIVAKDFVELYYSLRPEVEAEIS